jgi:hypothetical protein
MLSGLSAFEFDSRGSYFAWEWIWPFLLCFSGVVFALPQDRSPGYWEHLYFGLSLIYLHTNFSGYIYLGSMSGDHTGWQLKKRLLAIESLLLLLWFLASGFALRMRNGGDFVTAAENKKWSIKCLGRDSLLHFGAIPRHLAGRYDWFHASDFIALQHSDRLIFASTIAWENSFMTELFICVPATSFDVSS